MLICQYREQARRKQHQKRVELSARDHFGKSPMSGSLHADAPDLYNLLSVAS